MSNSQSKKAAALVYNANLDRKKVLEQDKIDNPEKYPKPKMSRKTGQFLAMTVGMGILL